MLDEDCISPAQLQVFTVKRDSIRTLVCLLCSTLLLDNLSTDRKVKVCLCFWGIKEQRKHEAATATLWDLERQGGRRVKWLSVTHFLSIRPRLMGLSSWSSEKNRGRFCQTSREDEAIWALYRDWRNGRVNFDLLGKRVCLIWQDVSHDVGITLISNRRMRECSWVKYRMLCSRAVCRLLLSTSLASVSLCLCPHSFSILSSLWFVSKRGQNIWSVVQTGREKGCEFMEQKAKT